VPPACLSPRVSPARERRARARLVAAITVSLGHPESYRLLVLQSGWSTNRWAAWVTDALVAALLRDG
jgi:hypothetical protein